MFFFNCRCLIYKTRESVCLHMQTKSPKIEGGEGGAHLTNTIVKYIFRQGVSPALRSDRGETVQRLFSLASNKKNKTFNFIYLRSEQFWKELFCGFVRVHTKRWNEPKPPTLFAKPAETTHKI